VSRCFGFCQERSHRWVLEGGGRSRVVERGPLPLGRRAGKRFELPRAGPGKVRRCCGADVSPTSSAPGARAQTCSLTLAVAPLVAALGHGLQGRWSPSQSCGGPSGAAPGQRRSCGSAQRSCSADQAEEASRPAGSPFRRTNREGKPRHSRKGGSPQILCGSTRPERAAYCALRSNV